MEHDASPRAGLREHPAIGAKVKEIKQAERYQGDPAYQEYVRRVPILFPLLPLYSLRRLRIYLG